MKAVEVMSKPVRATTPRASARDVATQMVVSAISGMPVCERDGTVVGVVTEADLLRALIEGKKLETLAAQDIMSTDPITADVESSSEAVMKALQDHHVLRVPVTDHGKLVGIISRIDLIRAVLEPEFMTF